jgi:hypothetical protein
MRGRIWLFVGVVGGIVIAAGRIPYLAGAGRSLADNAQRVIGTGGAQLVSTVARHGAPQRAVLGVTALVAVLIPGIAALLLIVAARSAERLRGVVAFLLAALGIAAFAYQPTGHALGAMVLALAVAGAAVALAGPLVVAPLAALAALIGAEFLPRLLAGHSTLPNAPVAELHRALFGTVNQSLWLRVVVLLVAAVPFWWAARLVLRR